MKYSVFAFVLVVAAVISAGFTTNQKTRITSIEALDGGDVGGTGDPSIDVIRDVCPDTTDEPFFDTILRIKVVKPHIAGSSPEMLTWLEKLCKEMKKR